MLRTWNTISTYFVAYFDLFLYMRKANRIKIAQANQNILSKYLSSTFYSAA